MSFYTSAQIPTQFTRVHGASDSDVPTPSHTQTTGVNATALQSILAFVRMSGITAWAGCTAQGSITFSADNVAYPATLYLLGADRYRLDVTKPGGTESTVYNGSNAQFVAPNGVASSLSSDIAVPGLLAFPRLLSAQYPTSNGIVADRGAVSLSGIALHRITLEDPSLDGLGSPWKTSDLYFNLMTGTLVRSVSFGHLSSSDAALYMIQTTYDDYRSTGAISLPYLFTRRLNGTLQWSLQLTTIDLHVLPDPSLFAF